MVRGLACHAGIEHGPMPAGTEEWLNGIPRPGMHFAVFDGLYPAMRRADIEDWSAGIARLGRSWGQPLLSALDSGAVVRVMIRDERGNRFTATRRVVAPRRTRSENRCTERPGSLRRHHRDN